MHERGRTQLVGVAGLAETLVKVGRCVCAAFEALQRCSHDAEVRNRNRRCRRGFGNELRVEGGIKLAKAFPKMPNLRKVK